MLEHSKSRIGERENPSFFFYKHPASKLNNIFSWKYYYIILCFWFILLEKFLQQEAVARKGEGLKRRLTNTNIQTASSQFFLRFTRMKATFSRVG